MVTDAIVYAVLAPQEHVAFISEEDLENPHIRYFDHLNPGWDKVTFYYVCTFNSK